MGLIVGVDLGTYVLKASYYSTFSKNIEQISFGQTSPLLPMNFRYISSNLNAQDFPFKGSYLKMPKRFMGKDVDELKKEGMIKVEDDDLLKIKYCLKNKKDVIEIDLIDVLEHCLETVYKALKNSNMRAEDACFVISIPHDSNDVYKKQMNEVLRRFEGKFGVKKIILKDEMEAAALSNSLPNRYDKGNILVVDFAKEKVDIAIVGCENTDQKVLGFIRSTEFGGKLIDERIKDMVLKSDDFGNFVDKLKNEDDLLKLNYLCSEAKFEDPNFIIDLSEFEIEDLDEVIVSKKEVEELSLYNIDGILSMINSVLEQSKIKTNEIDKVICIGGSSKFEQFQRMIRTKFDEKQLEVEPTFDYLFSVSQGLVLSELEKIGTELEKIPFSIGIKGIYGEMVFLFEKGDKVGKKAIIRMKVNTEKTKLLLCFGENVNCGNNKQIKEVEIVLGKETKFPQDIELTSYFYKDGEFKIEWNIKHQIAKIIYSQNLITEKKDETEEDKWCLEKRRQLKNKLLLRELYDEMRNWIEYDCVMKKKTNSKNEAKGEGPVDNSLIEEVEKKLIINFSMDATEEELKQIVNATYDLLVKTDGFRDLLVARKEDFELIGLKTNP